jgi:hypothetical protein
LPNKYKICGWHSKMVNNKSDEKEGQLREL